MKLIEPTTLWLRITRWLTLLILASTLCPSARAAQECTKETALAHAAAGIELAGQERFVAALTEFERALKCQPHYDVYYNIGQIQMALGRPVEAEQAIRKYLALGGDALTAEERHAAEADLQRVRARIAHVILRVHPPGAQVLVDGQLLAPSALGTPLALETGPHVFSVEAKGYRPERATTTLQRGDERTLEFRLERRSGDRQATTDTLLTLECALPDVEVRVNGRALGKAPLPPIPVSPGSVEVTLSRPGYASRSETQLALAGQTSSVDCTLRPLPNLAKHERTELTVISEVDGAEVRIDGRLFRGGLLPAGNHRLEVSRPGYVSHSKVVRLAPGAVRKHVRLEMEPWYAADLESAADETEWPTYRTASVALAAGAVGLGAAALVAWRVNHGQFTEWKQENEALFTDPQPSDFEARVLANNERARSVERLSTISGGLTVAAGALVASAVALWFLPSAQSAGAQSARWHAGVAPLGPHHAYATARLNW